MRARLAIARSAQTCELREVVLKEKPTEMIALSPKATVPVLQLPCGRVLDESLDIMRWALTQSDPDHWLSFEPDLTNSLIHENDFSFKQWLDRYKYYDRFPEKSQTDYRNKASEFLHKLETQLTLNNGIGLVADQLSLADMAIFPFIRQLRYADLNWFDQCDFPKLIVWEQQLESSSLFLAIMQKFPKWDETSSLILFPIEDKSQK